ncbi:MAG: dipeptidyl aminopeptidase/acylaminoacyl peptidase [Myxococcota bacterium]|jgi:dipeptidyl aminopeptidase/acylaminoacyl peptidase
MSWLVLLSAAVFAQARAIDAAHDGNCQAPVWAPGGERLAYEVNDHSRRSIALFIYTPGQPPRQIAPRPSPSALAAGFSTAEGEQVVHDAVWSPPELATFLYTAPSAAEDYDIYLHGGGALVESPGADGGAAWSPDGRYVAFTSARTGQGDLYLIDTHDVTAPATQLTDAPDTSELYAAFSPDSRGLAFVGHTDEGDQIFWIPDVTAAPMQAQPLVALGHTQTRPRYSPDGATLAFYSDHTQPGRFDLYVLDVESRALTLIDEGVLLNHRGPSWTPDGAHLVYVRDDDNQLDPVWTAPLADPGAAKPLQTGTVGNRDLDIVAGGDGQLWLAVAAQGSVGTGAERDFHRIFVAPLQLP